MGTYGLFLNDSICGPLRGKGEKVREKGSKRAEKESLKVGESFIERQEERVSGSGRERRGE